MSEQRLEAAESEILRLRERLHEIAQPLQTAMNLLSRVECAEETAEDFAKMIAQLNVDCAKVSVRLSVLEKLIWSALGLVLTCVGMQLMNLLANHPIANH